MWGAIIGPHRRFRIRMGSGGFGDAAWRHPSGTSSVPCTNGIGSRRRNSSSSDPAGSIGNFSAPRSAATSRTTRSALPPCSARIDGTSCPHLLHRRAAPVPASDAAPSVAEIAMTGTPLMPASRRRRRRRGADGIRTSPTAAGSGSGLGTSPPSPTTASATARPCVFGPLSPAAFEQQSWRPGRRPSPRLRHRVTDRQPTPSPPADRASRGRAGHRTRRSGWPMRVSQRRGRHPPRGHQGGAGHPRDLSGHGGHGARRDPGHHHR